MITGCEVKGHIQDFTKRAEEGGGKLRTTIGGDMLRNAVLREDMCDEDESEVFRGTIDCSWNEDCLLGESVDDYKNGVKTGGGRKRFNEVHRDGVPRTFGDRQLSKKSVRFVTLGFCTHTSSTRLAVVLDIFSESRPSVFSKDETCCFVLTRVTRENVIVLVTEDFETEVVRVRNVDEVVVTEETIGGDGPARFGVLGQGNVRWISW